MELNTLPALKEVFEAYENRRFLMVEPGGNQGDSMIYAGARKLADEVGLNYDSIRCEPEVTPPKCGSRRIIYLHGGGGFNDWWNWTPRLLKALRTQNPGNIIVVGPTTVACQKRYLEKYMPSPGRIIFFARERTTAEYVKRLFFPEHTALDHDTAFHLKAGDEYLTPLLGGQEPEQLFTFLGVREDPESPNKMPGGIDQSRFRYVADPCKTDMWAYLHVKASEIVTNRSHSAILGAILKKPTTLFPGNYHKNRSIYEYSLKKRGVKWIE